MCDKDGGCVIVSDDHSECGYATSDENRDRRGDGQMRAGSATKVDGAQHTMIGDKRCTSKCEGSACW